MIISHATKAPIKVSRSNCDESRRERRKTMSEKEKQVIEKLVKELPAMTEHERGYLEGTLATAAAMSTRKKEEKDGDLQ